MIAKAGIETGPRGLTPYTVSRLDDDVRFGGKLISISLLFLSKQSFLLRRSLLQISSALLSSIGRQNSLVAVWGLYRLAQPRPQPGQISNHSPRKLGLFDS